jgi:hypothetical protein
MCVKWRANDYRPARRLGSMTAQIVERLKGEREAASRCGTTASRVSAVGGGAESGGRRDVGERGGH